MRYFALIALLVVGCGKEIGDECIVSSDCSPDGDRLCEDQHCTIKGCDYDTCPDEAACVRFFSGYFSNKPCTQQVDCTLDELCSLKGFCVSRASEVRYCMRACDSNDDCPTRYECRDYALMKSHGGEPVLAPGKVVSEQTAPKFCAPAPLL
ncbi:MAG: hypothetical protein AB7O24_10705 [Kofleriaceae bacterium]